MLPRFIACLTIVISLTPASALADITPDDAWNIWQAQAKALGLTLDADETRDGDSLQIGEITLSATLPMNIAALSISFAGPRFSPDGDGAVTVSLPAKTQIRFAASITGVGDMEATLLMTRINESILMSGIPEIVKSRWESDGMRLNLTGLSSGGETYDVFTVAMDSGPYQIESTTTIGDILVIDFTSENDSYNLAYEYTIGSGDAAIDETGVDSATGISARFFLVLPLDGLRFTELPKQLRNALSLSYTGDLETYRSKQISSLGGQVTTSITQAIAAYHTALSFGSSGLAIDGTTGPIVADVIIANDSPELNFSFQAASAAGGLAFPLLQSDSPQNARYLMAMQDIRFNPEFWRLFDASGKLDHTPMSLRMEISGTVDIFVDLLDFAALMAANTASDVILPSSFNLDALKLSALGSELNANGAFTFDKSDMTTYDGIPRPDGLFELQLHGGNALLDQLIEANLVSKEQVLGIRMALSLIGQPGDGDDSLTSKIELTPEGHITANGQRLK